MKSKILIVLLLVIVSSNGLFAQSAADRVRSLAKSQDYVEAAAYIPEAMKEKWKDLEFITLAGDVYFELSNLDSALIMYDKANSLERNEPHILRRLGKTYSAMGRHKDAVNVLQKAIDEDKKNIENYLQLAQAYIAADSIPQAEVLITRTKTMEKNNPKVYIALGDLYFAQRVYELAKNNYEEALSLNENLVEARSRLATSYYWLGTREYDKDLANELFTRSLKEFQKVTQQDPKNADAYFQMGKIYHFSNLNKEAAMALYEYVQLRPSAHLGRWYLAQSLYEVNQCDSAAPHLEYASENIDSVRVKAKLLLARCYFKDKDYVRAASSFEKVRMDTSLDVMDLQMYGGALFLTEDTTKAIIVYREAIEKSPEQTCGLMDRLGRLMIMQKNYKEAINIFSKRLSTEGCTDDLAKSNYFVGISYLFDQKADSAIYYLDQACEMDTNDLNALLYLGDAYIAMAEEEKGLDYYKRVSVKGSTSDPKQYEQVIMSAYQKTCGLFLDKQNWNQLQKEALDWSKSQPELPYPWLYLAVSYQGQGDAANACKYYKKTLTLDPKNAPAKQNLAKLNCP